MATNWAPEKRMDPYDRRPRSAYLVWDDYFMAIAFLSAMRSKDPNRQVGACIVSPGEMIREPSVYRLLASCRFCPSLYGLLWSQCGLCRCLPMCPSPRIMCTHVRHRASPFAMPIATKPAQRCRESGWERQMPLVAVPPGPRVHTTRNPPHREHHSGHRIQRLSAGLP